MRKPRKQSLPILAVLCGGLGLWGAKQIALNFAEENEALVSGRLPDEDPTQPDTILPRATAHNAQFAGFAPGFSPQTGEKEDVITALNMTDRILVKKSRGRKGARPAALSGSAWEPDVYPTTKLFAAPGREVTPLNLRDPAALVLPPSDHP